MCYAMLMAGAPFRIARTLKHLIPLHIQRRFEQRSAVRFGSVIPDVSKNVRSKGSPVNIARGVAKAKEKPARLRRLASRAGTGWNPEGGKQIMGSEFDNRQQLGNAQEPS